MRDEKAWKWLNENELSYKIWNNKYRHNNESFDEWLDRVSNKDTEIRRLIYEKKFLFGGRTLANRGTNKGSLNNCYSAGFVPDSLEGIMQTATDIAMTFKAQGGQGLSLSKIRPKGSLINNTFQSDGIVPFMEIFNTVTDSISQGGSRKGALMMSLDINHPEIETFMKIKSDHNKITKANLSVEIDDAFMRRVETGDSEANRIFNILCEQACKHAEPGVLFTNKLRNYNLMEHVDSYQIETTNPCGEQPLPKGGCCGLSSINLSEYIKDPFTPNAIFNVDEFRQDIWHIIKAMDDLVDENLPNHALNMQREVAQKFRNLGVGVMGIQDMLIKLGLTYGKPESIQALEYIMKTIIQSAIEASHSLAVQRGSFPEYSERMFDSEFCKNTGLDYVAIDRFKKGGLRNSTLLSIAPTGSIGTMLNISSGVEPWFSMHYTRNTKSLEGKDTSYEVWAPIAEEANKRNWHPETLVTSNDISWKEHIDIQAVVQNYVDTAVSKTINMPKGTTPQEVREAYIYAWKKGLKGLTVYVDGSRDPILTTSPKQETVSGLDSIVPVTRKELGKKLEGASYKCKNACGGLYITINNTPNGDLVEVFANPTKQGGCKANLESLTRQVSDAMRSGIKISSIIDSLAKVQCQACVRAKAKGEVLDGSSCGDIVAKCIQDRYNELHNIKPTQVQKKQSGDGVTTCPECGEKLRYESGCRSCSCGWSKCG
jgi:ribonucleoside-diphosphate reductase alpha chain